MDSKTRKNPPMEQKNLSADTKIIPNFCDKTKNQLSKVKKGGLTSPSSRKRIVESSPPEPKVAKKNPPTMQKGLSLVAANKRTSKPLSPATTKKAKQVKQTNSLPSDKENQNQGPIEGSQSPNESSTVKQLSDSISHDSYRCLESKEHKDAESDATSVQNKKDNVDISLSEIRDLKQPTSTLKQTEYKSHIA
jgi:hypothetical protein